jgi:hypothetical protein
VKEKGEEEETLLVTIGALDVSCMVRALRRTTSSLGISKLLLLQLVLIQEEVGASRDGISYNWVRLGDHG